MVTASAAVQHFDLNIEKVLEHWPIPFAVRETIANALDEQAITRTAQGSVKVSFQQLSSSSNGRVKSCA